MNSIVLYNETGETLITIHDELEVTLSNGIKFIVTQEDIQKFCDEGIEKIHTKDLYDFVLINRL